MWGAENHKQWINHDENINIKVILGFYPHETVFKRHENPDKETFKCGTKIYTPISDWMLQQKLSHGVYDMWQSSIYTST